MRFLLLCGLLGVLGACASPPRESGEPVARAPEPPARTSVGGTVRLSGVAPTRRRWKLDEEMSAVAGREEYFDKKWLVDEQGGLQNCVVSLHPLGESAAPPPLEQALFEKVGPEYVPRILVVPAGTEVTLRNRNSPCRGFRGSTRFGQFNHMQDAGSEFTYRFERAGATPILCDVRPYMRGAIVAVDTPYYALTEADGSFRIPDVPAGEYRVRLWHEGIERERARIPTTLRVSGAHAPPPLQLELPAP